MDAGNPGDEFIISKNLTLRPIQGERACAPATSVRAAHQLAIACERGRAIGEAIVHEAVDHEVDLIVVGSAPRWRRQSRFFSPTVDYVLRKAPCEVMVIAYPQGVLEEAPA